MEIIWSNQALAQIQFWEKTNPKIKKRIDSMLDNMQQTPYVGIGKPEALKHELTGLWSRRIDREHRLIYSYNQETNMLKIESCKGHYS